MNNVSLVGRITKDPELRTVSDGLVVTSFTIAINRPFTNASGEREADFIFVTAWRRLAENIVKYCGKGSLVGVTGRIQTSSFDAEDGTRRYRTEVYAENVHFLETRRRSELSGSSDMVEPTPSNNETSDISEDPFKDFGSEVVLSDDDLPF